MPTQVRFPGAARDFPPRVNFQSRVSKGVRTSPLAIASIYGCAHVKDPVAHVRVRWIMETLKHPVCTVGWLARPCRSWLSPGKAIRISHRRNSIWTIQLLKVKKARLPFPLSTPNPNYSCSPFAQQGKSVKRVFQDFAVMLGNRQTFC